MQEAIGYPRLTPKRKCVGYMGEIDVGGPKRTECEWRSLVLFEFFRWSPLDNACDVATDVAIGELQPV